MKYLQSKIYILFWFCCSVFYACDAEKTNHLINDLKAGKYEFFLQTNGSTYRKIQKLGNGSAYYVGLHLKQAGYNDAAKFYFRNGIKSCKEPFKKLCRIALYDIAESMECLECIEEHLRELSTGPSADSTVNDAEKKMLNQLKLQHLVALQQYEKLNGGYKAWCQTMVLTPLSIKNLKLYSNTLPDFMRLIIEVRIAVFEKSYVSAWKKIQDAFSSDYALEDIVFAPLLSEIGKAGLYGAGDEQAALFFETLMRASLNIKNNKISNEQVKYIRFYAAFYAARIYTRAGKQFFEKANVLFMKAAEYAPSDSDFDTALWYYLDTLKKISFSQYEAALVQILPSWKNPQWYGDLVQYLQLELLTKKNWQAMNALYAKMQQTNLTVHRSSIAYILARSGALSHNKAQSLLQEIKNTPSSPLYYRLLAAYHLHEDMPFLFFPMVREKKESMMSSENAHAVLDGLIRFGLLSMVYKQAAAFSTTLDTEKIFTIAQTLADNRFYDDSMKMMLLTQGAEPLTKEQLYLLYPRPWLDTVKKYAAEYQVPEYFLYALIRSESFFNPKAVSRAGAVGLTQLMPTTAADIARKLKIAHYDLTDPALNIRFGAYYIAEMIRRSNNQILSACFAYNAGLSRVRLWQKERNNLPDDLFLENLEYGETREYGKRIFATAMMYAHLYYKKNPEDVVKEFFPFF